MEALDAIPWVACHCSKCDRKLFEAQNEWARVNSTFVTISSALGQLHVDEIATLHVETFDQIGAAELIGCTLRRISCVNCQRSVGAKCIETSLQLSSYRGGGLLKLSRIKLRSLSTGCIVDIMFQPDNPTSNRMPSMPRASFSSKQSIDNTSVGFDRNIRDIDSPARHGELRKPLVNGGDNSSSIVIAKLNVITSQLTAHESRFEAQRVQIDEQQAQLDALLRQNEQIVDLLENLTKGISELRDDIQSQAQLRQEHGPVPVESHNTFLQTDVSARNPLKRPRGRGRPRIRCSICRKEPLFGNSDFCENCYASRPRIKRQKLTKYAMTRKAAGQGRSISSNSSIYSFRDADENVAPDGRSEEDDSASGDIQSSVPSKSNSIVSISATSKAAKADKSLASNLAGGTMVILDGISPHRAHSREPEQTEQNNAPGLSLPTKAQSPTLSNAPFIEDSGPQVFENSDLVEAEAVEESKMTGLPQHSRSIPVAPSITADDLAPDKDGKMQLDDDSLEDGEILSQGNDRTKNRLVMPRARGKQRETSRSIQTTKPLATAKPTGPLPQPRAPATFMSLESSNNGALASGLDKPRKPKSNNEADGDDTHSRIISKVMGKSWLGVKRRW